MNQNAVTRNYSILTPEERFRLILAAGARGDNAEQERFVRAGKSITLSMSDHSPYAHAFQELANLTFIELLDEAARYHDAFVRANEACDVSGDEVEDDEADSEAEGDEPDQMADTKADGESGKDSGLDRHAWEPLLDLGLAAGFVLRTKSEGWKLFCERINVPPFLLWEAFPGFDRLQRALALVDRAAFAPEGFLRWINEVRPAGEPELAEVSLTVVGVADATEQMFRERVAWWRGELRPNNTNDAKSGLTPGSRARSDYRRRAPP